MQEITDKLKLWKTEREVDEHNESYSFREGYVKAMSDVINLVNRIYSKSNVINWVAFDFENKKTHPSKYGKYFVHRKDGKIHWETWNGNGWAYNGNVITFWKEIKPPCL